MPTEKYKGQWFSKEREIIPRWGDQRRLRGRSGICAEPPRVRFLLEEMNERKGKHCRFRTSESCSSWVDKVAGWENMHPLKYGGLCNKFC